MISRIGLPRRSSALSSTALCLVGAVVLTLSCSDGPTAPAPIGSIVVTPSSQVVASGASTTLSAAVLDAKGGVLAGRVITWGASDAALATVTGPGQVTAGQNRGGTTATVTITASSEGRSGSATLNIIPVPAARVVLSADSLVMQPGATNALTVAVQDAAGVALSGRTVSWVALDTTIALVSSTGQVTVPGYAGPDTRTTRVVATAEGLADTARIVVAPLAVFRVVLTPDSVALLPGGTTSLSAAVRDSAGTALTGRTITWSSSDTAVATVAASGTVTAAAYTGGATRTARLVAVSEGQRDSTTLTVTPLPVLTVAIAGTPSDSALVLGDSLRLSATLSGAGGVTLTGRSIAWSSSDASRASVSGVGVVTPVGAGLVTISAASEGQSVGTVVLVKASVAVPPASASQPITTTVLGGAVAITVPPGATTATALTVAPAPTPPTDDRALAGAAYVFGPAGTTFSTPVTIALRYDPAAVPAAKREKLRVALVTASGLEEVPGGTVDLVSNVVSVGVTHFSVYTLVVPPDPSSIEVIAGAGQQAIVGTAVSTAPQVRVLDAQGRPISRERVRFTVASGGGSLSDTTSVATEADGRATMRGTWTLGSTVGAQTLTASVVGSAVSGTVTATGTEVPVATLVVTPASAAVAVGATQQLAAELKDAAGNVLTGRPVTWTSSDAAKATVSSTGLVTALMPGAVAVTATSGDVSGTASVTITRVASTVELSAATVNLAALGATSTVAAVVKDGSGAAIADAAVEWTSSDPAVATVTGGTVTAVANGSAVITATSGSVSATVAVTVAQVATRYLVAASSTAPPAGGTVTITAQLADANGNAVATLGKTVTWSKSNANGSFAAVTSTTNASGIATVVFTVHTVAGTPTTVTATDGDALTGTSPTITTVAGPASQLAINGGNNGSATVGTAVTTAPSVLVTDANANAVVGVSVTFAVASGGGSVTGASATTNASGIASVGSWTLGTAAGANTLTATSAGLSGSPITFTATGTAGSATQIAVNAGNVQSATVGTAVATAPSVLVRDANNNPVASVAVTFAVVSGGGSITGGSATTDASGIAAVGSWTLGTTAGANALTATSGTLTGSPVTFTATGTAGAAAQYLVTASNTSPPAGGTVTITAQLADANGNAVATPGKTITWSKSHASGSFAAATSTTNASGIATVVFTAHTVAGTATTVTATDGDALAGTTATITTVAGAATSAILLDSETQVTRVSTATAKRPGVRLADAYGNRVRGVTVSFSVASGSGSVTGASVLSDAQGEARVESWTMGAASTTNSLTIQVPGFTNGTVYSRAVPNSSFPIDVRLLAGTSTQYQQLMNDAADRWRKAIVSSASDVFVSSSANSCFTGQPAISESTTGVIVYAEVKTIDGPGGTLAQAGFCLYRTSSGLPAVGYMAFDVADLDPQIADGSAFGTAVHELGHVLRIGPGWDFWGLRQDVGSADPIFTGADARWAFDQIGGLSYSGRIVPLENTGGAGSRDVHWRESVMGRELMTPSILSGQTSQPFSAITLFALQDMGYGITGLGYDDYTVASNLMALGEQPVPHKFKEDLDLVRPRAIDDRTGVILDPLQQAQLELQMANQPSRSTGSRTLPLPTFAIQPTPLNQRP